MARLSLFLSNVFRHIPLNSLLLGISVFAGGVSSSLAAPFGDAATASDCPTSAFLVQTGRAKFYDIDLVIGDYSLLEDDVFTDGSTGKINALGYSIHDHFLYGWSYPHRSIGRIGDDFKVTDIPVTMIFPDQSQVSPTTSYYIGDVSTTVGDFAYYVYKPGDGNGTQRGLWRIELDSGQTQDQYTMVQVAPRMLKNGTTANDLNIYDFAFHASDGFAYSVDGRGKLWRIDVSNGHAFELANMDDGRVSFSLRGVYGAVYFDADHNLYFSRNSDGSIFRVAIGDGTGQTPDYIPELFAVGPASSSNDGARCALASVVPFSDDSAATQADRNTRDIDFGDAPFESAFADNGARHGILRDNDGEPTFYLGTAVDGESDSYVFPLSDDTDRTANTDLAGLGEQTDDENGVQLATDAKLGSSSNVLMVKVENEAGIVDPKFNYWIDLNNNQTFENEEHLVQNEVVSAGVNFVSYTIPTEVASTPLVAGSVWSRARLSSDNLTAAVGGTKDGEVEDFQLDLQSASSAPEITWYPSKNSYTTIAFEDNWPLEGDYDMNDLVTYLNIATTRVDGDAVSVEIEGEIVAAGAAYHNGFAIRIPNVAPSDIENFSLKINNAVVASSTSPNPNAGLEDPGTATEAIFIIAEDVWDYVTQGEEDTDGIIQRVLTGGGTVAGVGDGSEATDLAGEFTGDERTEFVICDFYRTQRDCGGDIDLTFSLSIKFTNGFNKEVNAPFDPFLFATPGRYHGYLFYGYNGAQVYGPPGRAYEIHLKNQAPTEKFDPNLMGNVIFDPENIDDVSNPTEDIYYQSSSGLPWALEIGTRWRYPREFQDLILAYPRFQDFVESDGSEFPDWYASERANELYIFDK